MGNSAVNEAISQLTEVQREAVNHGDGPVLVLAGPGSGKTRVLTTRIAKLLSESEGRSFNVLALTFTNKAADEMATRVAALVPEEERRSNIGTFHSFCMQMLQQHGTHIGIRPDFAIYSLESDRQELLREALRRASDLTEDDLRYLPLLDKLKARLVPPENAANLFKDREAGQHTAKVYKAYEDALLANNALDFGSLISKSFHLISTYPGVALSYRRSYAYWLIDEFQDTTDGQYRLIQTLAGEKFKNVMAVADDDQIIYQWNGASYQQLQRFREDFHPKLIQLSTNYRCPPGIVDAANRLVLHNAERTENKKPLEAGKTRLQLPAEKHLRVRRFRDDDSESKGIATEILGMPRGDWGNVVILARTRAILEKAQTALSAISVPCTISQRRDDFRSPQFQWLSSAIRQAARPMDKRNFQNLVSSFNKWFGLSIQDEQVLAEAEASGRTYFEEWAHSLITDTQANSSISAASAAITLARTPSSFLQFIDKVLPLFPPADEQQLDLAEDFLAWNDLVRSIGQSVGRDAPLEQFLQELAIRSKEPPAPTGAVTLMTIHGSKGKEFDHVFLVGLAEDVLPSFQSLKAGSNSSEMEEERRNCFVAITRTRESLCLSWADKYKGWTKRPSRFLSEMELELPSSPE